jgi:hypothetical protein
MIVRERLRCGAGFMDTEPLLREATVKASLHLAPVLNGANGDMLLK